VTRIERLVTNVKFTFLMALFLTTYMIKKGKKEKSKALEDQRCLLAKLTKHKVSL